MMTACIMSSYGIFFIISGILVSDLFFWRDASALFTMTCDNYINPVLGASHGRQKDHPAIVENCMDKGHRSTGGAGSSGNQQRPARQHYRRFRRACPGRQRRVQTTPLSKGPQPLAEQTTARGFFPLATANRIRHGKIRAGKKLHV